MVYIEYLSPEALSQNESEAIEAIKGQGPRPKDKAQGQGPGTSVFWHFASTASKMKLLQELRFYCSRDI